MWDHSWILNRLYNRFITLEQMSMKTDDKFLSAYDLCYHLPKMKENEDLEGLGEIYSQVLQVVAQRVAMSFKAWFRKHNAPPHFRSGHKFFNITYPQSTGFKIMKHVLHTTAYGDIRIRDHRKLRGTVKQMTLAYLGGKFFVIIVTDHDSKVSMQDTTPRIVGIDVGLSTLATVSDGTTIPRPDNVKYYDRKINHLKARRDHKDKTKYSWEYNKLSETIQRLYDAKNRKLNDYLHKASSRLSRSYGTVCVEDLNVKKLSGGKITGLNREMRNVGLGRLLTMLEHKCAKLIKVNPHNTTKACYACGKIHKMPLHKRTMVCECGVTIDRDLNAALNILHLGKLMLVEHLPSSTKVEVLKTRLFEVVDAQLLVARDGPVLRTAQV